MKKSTPITKAFIDTNILKFAAVKKYIYRRRQATVNWGGQLFESEYRKLYTLNDIHKIKNAIQRQDAMALAMLAYAGISGQVEFYIHREVEFEVMGLPAMTSPSGRFFGCPIKKVADPQPPRVRIIAGGNKSHKEHSLDFMCSIENPRFIELIKMTGAYQGKSKPLNLNQARDAYHIWCAENAQVDYFLTMDYKLKKVVEQSKIKTAVKIVTPVQFLKVIVPKFGFVGALKFLWSGYQFAKPRVGFDETDGWT